MRFSGKVAIVTGATAGIGLAVAELLHCEGAKLVLNARSLSDLTALAEKLGGDGCSPLVVAGDVGCSVVVAELVACAMSGYGRIDILVNNAGGGRPRAAITDITEPEYEDLLRVNLQAAFFLSKAVVPVMQGQSYGRIVNISSLAGRQHSILANADYAAAKAGLLGLTRQLAWELGPSGINVNAVAPGVTASARVSAKWQGQTQAYRDQVLNSIPLRRIGEPREVANAVAFLASDAASYITGVTLDVNGGASMQ